MSRMGSYVQEKQERLYRKGIDVDDTNDLQGGERDEWEEWLDQQAEVSDEDIRPTE